MLVFGSAKFYENHFDNIPTELKKKGFMVIKSLNYLTK